MSGRALVFLLLLSASGAIGRRGAAQPWVQAAWCRIDGAPGTCSGLGSSGTVTSVGLSAPSIFAVSGSPVSTSGTLGLSLSTQTANTVFAGPTSGGAVAPAFRALVTADIPSTLTVLAGSGSDSLRVSGTLASAGVAAATTGTSQQTLFSQVIAANTFSANGIALRWAVNYKTAANANSKTVTITFGSTTLITRTAADNNGQILASGLVTRNGANSFVAISRLFVTASGTTWIADVSNLVDVTETTSSTITFAAKATTPTTAGDATFKQALLELVPQ